MASYKVAFTIDEAVTVLDPPMTHRQLADLIAALRIRPVGKRPQPRRGRPTLTYDAAELMRLHAAVAPWLKPSALRHVAAAASTPWTVGPSASSLWSAWPAT
jgi:hypothetical protein